MLKISILPLTFFLLTASGCACLPAFAENIVYPADAGVLNVKTEFGARGDGVADDTAAIQKALSAAVSKHKIVYLPDGVYRVSDTLKWNNGDPASANGGWAPFAQLQGQSRAKTVIQLAEGAAGFGDVAVPKAVVQTASSAGHGNKTYKNGEGNEAFENHIRNLSIDAGKNAGAIGIDYQVSNCGALRDVSIRGTGVVGLRLERRDNGPGLVKNLSVEGFNEGIRARQEICQMTFENIALSGQKEAGIRLDNAIFAIRKLSSRNAVPAIQVSGTALLVLLDGDLSGGAAGQSAIHSADDQARFYLRNIKAEGYGAALKRGEKTEKGPISEWAGDMLGQAGTPLSLNLPIRETPEWWDADLKNWAFAGAPSQDDDTAAIQKAMNAGQSTVYFAAGTYRISDTISVPPHVRLIVGMGTQISAKTGAKNTPLADDKPMFRFAGGSASDVTIFDRFTLSASKGRLVDHAGPRTVVLRDLVSFSTREIYRNGAGSGPLFIEDVAGAVYKFDHPTQVWARQWNIEGDGGPRIVGNGATIWALGWKQESGATILQNVGGAVEFLGGLTYTFGIKPEIPAFRNSGDLAVSFAGTTYMGPNGFYRTLVSETRGATTRALAKNAAPARGGGVNVALYVSRAGSDLSQIAALSEAAPAATQTVADEKPAPTGEKKPEKSEKPKKEAVAAPGITPETAVSKQGEVTVFRLPDSWKGSEEGAATGNPLVLAAKPTWRFDSLGDDDAAKWENYAPLVWSGKKWHAKEKTFGRPEASVSAGVARPTARGAWSGQPGKKRAALVFIAPSAGKYSLEGSAEIDFFNGDNTKPMSFDFVKLDPAAKTATVLSSLEVAHQTPTTIKVEVQLGAGEELAIVPQIARRNTAANVRLSGLKVSLAAR